MVVHQGLNKRYVRLSSLLEAELSAVRLDPSQSLSTLDQDLDGVLVKSSLLVNPDPKDLMAVQTRDRSDVGFVDSLEHWKQGALFFRQNFLDSNRRHRRARLKHRYRNLLAGWRRPASRQAMLPDTVRDTPRIIRVALYATRVH